MNAKRSFQIIGTLVGLSGLVPLYLGIKYIQVNVLGAIGILAVAFYLCYVGYRTSLRFTQKTIRLICSAIYMWITFLVLMLLVNLEMPLMINILCSSIVLLLLTWLDRKVSDYYSKIIFGDTDS